MGKGKSSSGKTYVSKGSRRSSIGAKNKNPADRMINKINALRKGKDITYTLPNPDKTQTNRPFIKHKISGKEYLAAQKEYKRGS